MQSARHTLKSIATRRRLRAVVVLGLSLMIAFGTWLSTGHHLTRVAVATAGDTRETEAKVSIPPTAVDSSTKTRLVEEYGKLPLQFEVNVGQVANEVKFLSRGSGYMLFLTPTEAVLSLNKPAASKPLGSGSPEQPRLAGQRDDRLSRRRTNRVPGAVVRMQLLNGNKSAQIVGAEELPGKTNYFIGNDPKQWRTNVSTYKKVRYGSVYPGVDLVYYGNQRQLEYDFVVSPGADPRAIRLRFVGGEKLLVDAEGELLLKIKGGEEIRQHRPKIYQEISGLRREVAGKYVLHGRREVGFEIAEYDAATPLVIDPTLTYSTYLGGHNNDRGYSIAVDGAGNAYVTGDTDSTLFFNNNTFPTVNPILPLPSASFFDVFVTKFNPSGSALIYSTYFGGTNNETGNAIAVDFSGNAYITGTTASSNFPLANARQSTRSGFTEAFVTKLNAAGSAFVYSTYHGGSGDEAGRGIATDLTGNAYVTGSTSSGNFPLANARQPAPGGLDDAFVSQFNPSGSTLLFSTYHGGSQTDIAYSIAVAVGSAYVTGYTTSNNFPTANARQPNTGGSVDAFVTKFSAGGTALTYSTYLGGSGIDIGYGIAVDSGGSSYVTGRVDSGNFPIANAFRATSGGSGDAFVTKLNPAGSAFVYSTYLGGNNADYGTGIAADSAGNAYISGYTFSTNFPTANALQSISAGTGGSADAFVTKLNAAGSALLYSTYLGNTGDDFCQGIAKNGTSAYIVGFTSSQSFPVTVGALQTSKGGSGTITDAFVARIDEATDTVYHAIGGQLTRNGQPLPGVSISLSGSSSKTTTTNAEGRYLFPLLQAGSYTVTPDSNYSCTPALLTYSPLTGSIVDGDFIATQLPAGWATVSGRVRNINGHDINATVRISGDLIAEKSVDGFYSFDLQPGGGTFTVVAVRSPVTSFSPATFTTSGGSRTFNFDATSPLVSVTGQLMNLTQGSDSIEISVGGTGLTSKACDVTSPGGVFQYKCSDLSIYGDYTVVPTSSTYNFDPISRSYSEIPGNVVDAHFGAAIPQLPTVTTSAATTIALTGATLNGSVNPNGLATNAWFEWGTDPTLSTNTATTQQAIGAGVSNQQVSAGLTGLIAATKYYFRAVGMNSQGTNRGSILNFTTTATLTVASTNPSSGVSITVSPNDNGAQGNGLTQFTRTYHHNTVVSLTAPATAAGKNFQKWLKDGADFAANQLMSVGVTMDANHTMTAVYVTPPAPTVQFSAPGYAVNEGGVSAAITVSRSGDTSGATSVDFATSDGSATQSQDYVVTSGTINFAAGETGKSFNVLIVDDAFVEAGQTINLNLSNATGATLAAPSSATITITDNDTAGSTSPAAKRFAGFLNGVQETPANNSSAKGTGYVLLNQAETTALIGLLFQDLGSAEISAHIHGNGAQGVPAPILFTLPTTNPVTNFQINPTAPQVADLKAGLHYFNVHTANFTGGEIRGQLRWNPTLEENFFVRQQYLDFLSRDGDPGGFGFWVNQVGSCQADAQCLHDRTISTANAFFFEPEFQQTAGYVFRAYRAAYGNNQPFPNPDGSNATEANKLIDYTAFVADRARVVGGANLATAQQAFANQFVLRTQFTSRYAPPLSGPQFVDAILANILSADGVNLTAQRQALIDQFNSAGGGNAGRAMVLYRLSDDNPLNPINNQAFITAEYNRQFALTLYFGYLRRNPDIGGFLFWQSQINLAAIRDVPKQNALVCSFLTAAEYQLRFGPNAPRSNAECPQ